jgi:hypothetical protein
MLRDPISPSQDWSDTADSSILLGPVSIYNVCFLCPVTREKRLDLAKKQTTRSVYQCHVIGPRGSGKSMLCRCFIGDNLEVRYKRFVSRLLSCGVMQSVVDKYQYFAGTSCLHFQGHPDHCNSSTLKVKARGPSQKLLPVFRNTQCLSHSRSSYRNAHDCKNCKSRVNF